jgi:hypothetical protein
VARYLARASDYACVFWYITAALGADELDGEPVSSFEREEVLATAADLIGSMKDGKGDPKSYPIVCSTADKDGLEQKET